MEKDSIFVWEKKEEWLAEMLFQKNETKIIFFARSVSQTILIDENKNFILHKKPTKQVYRVKDKIFQGTKTLVSFSFQP